MTLSGTEPLTIRGDLAAQMVEGIHRFFDRELVAARERRTERWNRDLSSPEAYELSVRPNRERLRRYLGVVDEREQLSVHFVRDVTKGRAEDLPYGVGENYRVYGIRWTVLRGVEGEGLLLEPEGKPWGNVIALGDCDMTPETLIGLTEGVSVISPFPRRLAENGYRVLVPVLIDRRDTYSGAPEVRMTNQPHREFLYRAAFELGRHIIGYEVQKVLAAVDWFCAVDPSCRVGVVGYGEGGLVAFYAGALDPRVAVVGVSGYFQPRENVWEEPIYRNVFGLLDEFGDAEVASLIAPRVLVVEASPHPRVSGPPPPREGRSGAAPGVLKTPPFEAVRAEFQRALALARGLTPSWKLVESDSPGSEAFLNAFVSVFDSAGLEPEKGAPRPSAELFDPDLRMKRQFLQILEHTQYLMREAEYRRAELWRDADATNLETWQKRTQPYRQMLWEEVIGKLPPATVPPHPRSRLVFDEPAYRGYEVVLDVYPDVFAYGILLLPKDLSEGERRPVVVCQHGLEGRPQDVSDPRVQNDAYNQYACRLAERGFITFSPQNPYIGGDAFRTLQRKANPLKKSLFSVIVRQHERILEWLGSLPFVDASRIGFYGLSYGGKTAMRVPALLTSYCLSICSADFNEWIWKNTSARAPYSYLFTGEYEMFEFNLGNTFNYAEMSWLICPRPFMVERGHHDGVAPDEWVAYEFAKTWRRYSLLGIGDRAEMEVFNGPHSIHGVGTFRFLERHLNGPPQG